jgi:phenylalanyl-tRNA synthetase beta chain
LRAIGLRPINILVDITNFISYDRARPLHVYDAAKLSGGIVARMGQTGESFVALDGKSYELTAAMCVIGDASGPLGLGGIMGGVSSGCSDDTVDVFVESALFAPLNIAQTARALGIQSDAKYRFERGVDSGFMVDGLELATAMILELCGGTASHVVVAGEVPAAPESVPFATKEVHRLTGLELSDGEIDTILSALGFSPEVTGAGLRKVGVPSWRRDVAGSADLVEIVPSGDGVSSWMVFADDLAGPSVQAGSVGTDHPPVDISRPCNVQLNGPPRPPRRGKQETKKK